MSMSIRFFIIKINFNLGTGRINFKTYTESYFEQNNVYRYM